MINVETGGQELTLHNAYKDIRLNFKYNLICFLLAIISFVQTILQVNVSIITQNYMYFFSCVWFGPLQIIASILILCISKFYLIIDYIKIWWCYVKQQY